MKEETMKAQRFTLLWLLLALAVIAIPLTACGPSWPDCDNDDHCIGYDRGANFCVDGVCRDCLADTDCERGQECRNNSCSAIPNWCEGHDGCLDGQICENNRCRAGCDLDAGRGCPEGHRCDNGRCVDDRECTLDRDCGSGQCCDNFACIACTPCRDREFEVVLFDFDESAIKTNQEARLEHNAECLNEFTEDEARIEGHCDERGTDAYNLALGERRARAAKRFLEGLGISSRRMDIISYGESRPSASCHDESCWRQNRRAEFGWR